MPLYMPQPGANYDPPPEGAHVAVCYRVVDLGTQETTYMGQPRKSHVIMLAWELPDTEMTDGRPFSISKRYTYSSHSKSTLRKDLESWRGKRFEDSEFGTFDIGNLLGKPCMLNVVHTEKNQTVYANIAAIMRLPKGMNTPALHNEQVLLSLADRPFDRGAFEKLSDRLRETIMKSPEYRMAIEGRSPDEEVPPPNGEGDYLGGDDIPF